MNTRVLDERKFKSSGSKVLGHRGKKWAEEERHRKKHLQASLVMGEKRSRRYTPRCNIAKQPEMKTSIICVGFFFPSHSLFRSKGEQQCNLLFAQSSFSQGKESAHTVTSVPRSHLKNNLIIAWGKHLCSMHQTTSSAAVEEWKGKGRQ